MRIVALLVFIAVTVVMNPALKRDTSVSLVVAPLSKALLGGVPIWGCPLVVDI